MNETGGCPIGGTNSRRRDRPMLPEQLWDRWLRFHEPGLESSFLHAWRELLAGADLFVMLNGLVRLGAIYTVLARSRRQLGVATHLELVALMATVALITIRNCSWTGNGLSCRSVWIGCHRVLIAVGATKAQALLDPPSQTLAGVIHWLLFESTSTQMAVLSFALPLQFKDHVIAHSICLLVCAAWTSPLCCRLWCEAGRECPAFARIVPSIDVAFTQVASLGMASIETSSIGDTGVESDACWLVLSFIHAAVGFVLPTAVLYCGELYMRLKFLVQIGVEVPRATRQVLYCSSALMACWISAVFLMCVWAMLRLLQGMTIADGGLERGHSFL